MSSKNAKRKAARAAKREMTNSLSESRPETDPKPKSDPDDLPTLSDEASDSDEEPEPVYRDQRSGKFYVQRDGEYQELEEDDPRVLYGPGAVVSKCGWVISDTNGRKIEVLDDDEAGSSSTGTDQ